MKLYKIKKYQIVKNEVICNVGTKKHIVLSTKDFSKYKETGLYIKNRLPYIIKTIPEGTKSIQDAYNTKTPLIFKPISQTGGGYIVQHQEVKAFLPNSQFIFGIDILKSFAEYPLYVIEYENNLIVSKSPNKCDDEISSKHIIDALYQAKDSQQPIYISNFVIHSTNLVILKNFKSSDSVCYVGSIVYNKYHKQYRAYLYQESLNSIEDGEERQGSYIIKNYITTVKLVTGICFKHKTKECFKGLEEVNNSRGKFMFTIKNKDIVLPQFKKDGIRVVRVIHEFNYLICMKTKDFIDVSIFSKQDRANLIKNRVLYVKDNKIFYPSTEGQQGPFGLFNFEQHFIKARTQP